MQKPTIGEKRIRDQLKTKRNLLLEEYSKNPGDSDEVDQHSALMPISVPGWSDQSSERSDAGFCILLKVIAIVKLVVVEAV